MASARGVAAAVEALLDGPGAAEDLAGARRRLFSAAVHSM